MKRTWRFPVGTGFFQGQIFLNNINDVQAIFDFLQVGHKLLALELPAFSFQPMEYFLYKKILEYVMIAPKSQPANTSLVQCTPRAKRLQPIKAKTIPEITIRFVLAFGYTS